VQETRPLWVKKLLNISEGSVATCLSSGGIIGEFTAVSHGVWILKVSHHQKSLGKVTPGWAGARRQLLDFMVQWEINRGRHTDHPAGRHAIQTNQCPPPPLPHIFYGPDALPATQPTVSKHWRHLSLIIVITSAQIILTRGRIRGGDFLLRKFNATLNSFSGWTTGTPVDGIRGNPDVRGHWEQCLVVCCKIITPTPQNYPSVSGDLDPHLTDGSSGPSQSTSGMTSLSVQPLSQGPQMWLTDRQTDRLCHSTCSNRLHVASAVMWPNNDIISTDKMNNTNTGGDGIS